MSSEKKYNPFSTSQNWEQPSAQDWETSTATPTAGQQWPPQQAQTPRTPPPGSSPWMEAPHTPANPQHQSPPSSPSVPVAQTPTSHPDLGAAAAPNHPSAPATSDSIGAVQAQMTAPPPTATEASQHTVAALELTRRIAGGLGAHLRQAILGRDEVIELLIVALLADGHVLLEDYPGSGKTTLAKALGLAIHSTESSQATFNRIQFTPDLLPSDITGVSIFSPQTGEFKFAPGPIFSHVVLADEINRTPPKVQSAMLEAMAEKQVTADGKRYKLDSLFFVIATQNPLDVTGTYPLPTPQLDRFLFKIKMEYIDSQAEMDVLDLHLRRAQQEAPRLTPVSREEILECRRAITQSVQVAPPIRRALVEIAQQIRNDPRVLQGVSTRSLVVALPALQAHAAMKGRDYVNAEDLRVLGPHLFGHRIERAPGSPDAETIFREAARQPFERLVQELLNPSAAVRTPPVPAPPGY